MRALGLTALLLVATASAAVAFVPRTTVSLRSRACCEDCTVARYRPEGVPVVPTTMVTGALLLESLLAASGLAAFGLVRRRRNTTTPAPSDADASARA